MSHLNKEKNIMKTESSDLISMLTHYWDQNSINKQTRQVYLDLFKTLPHEKLSKFIEYELKSYSNNSSLLLILIQSIEIREQSLSSIRDMDQYLKEVKGWEKKIEVITECAEMLQSHRMITLSCVENLVNWIIQIYYFTGHVCTYTHKNKSYMEKILKDSTFHQFAEMTKFFKFSSETDPFLLTLTDQVSVKIDSNLSNFFIKSKKFSIPVHFALSDRISQMQKFITNGELSKEVLEEKKKNFQFLIENNLGNIEKKKKRRENALVKLFMNELIDESIEDDIWVIAKTLADVKIAKLILFKYLDLTKTIKNIVKDVIKDLNNEKKIKTSFSSEKKKSKHELIKREDSKSNLKNFVLNSPESTRPSFAFSLVDGESLMNKLMAVTNTIKGKRSPLVRKTNVNSPSNFNFIDKKDIKQEEIKIGFEFAPNTKSMKYKIKNEIEVPQIHKSKYLNETRHESTIRNKNVLEKHSEIILNKSVQIKTKTLSSNSPTKQKLSDPAKLEPLNQLNLRPTFLNISKTPIKLAPIQKPILQSPSPSESKNPENLQNLKNLKKLPKTSKTQKFDLFNSIITEGIYRNILETLIKETKLSKIAEDSIKNSISSNPSQVSSMSSFERSLLLWKLQTKIYNSLIESFLSSSWLIDLVTLIKDYSESPGRSRLNSVELSETFRDQIVEEPEDYIYEVFTPRVHSPNVVLSRIESISEQSEKSEPNSLIDSNKKFSQTFQLIVSSYVKMKVLMEKYLNELGKMEKKNSTDLKTIFELAKTGEDLCWFRFVDGNLVKGMAGVCSVWQKDRRVGMVIHVSSKDWMEIGKVVEELLGFLRLEGFGLAVFRFGRVDEGVREIAEEKGMKVDEEKKELWIDFNTQSSFDMRIHVNHSLKTFTSENVKIGFKEPNTAMLEFGSHLLVSSHLLSLLNEPSSFQPAPSSIRLQSDLSELLSLQISQTLPPLSTPTALSTSPLIQISTFSLSFTYPCTSRSFLHISSQTYASLTFHQSTYCKTDHFSIYFVKTSNPIIEVAFIVYPGIFKELLSDMKQIKTDVFTKAENILQSAQERKIFNKELCIPAFNKKIDWEVNWIKGFDLEDRGVISTCEEKVSWEWRLNEKIVNSVDESASFKVKEEFIVVVVDSNVFELLDVPLCAALVREKDWVRVG